MTPVRPDRPASFIAPPTLALALLGCLALTACKRDEAPEVTPAEAPQTTTVAPAEPPVAAPVPGAAPATVAGVELGTAVDADNRITTAAATFAPTDTIHAAVATNAASAGATPTTLTARWTYQDGQVVKEDTAQAQLSGPGMTTFSIDSPSGFPTGRYKVEILMDGEVVQNRNFEVR